MALWHTEHFSSAVMMVDRLNGALIGTIDLSSGAIVDNLTFIYEKGGGDVTVTFAPAKSRPWSLTEIVAQINASIEVAYVHNPGLGDYQLRVRSRNLKIIRDGYFTVRSTGTANSVLGFSTTADFTNNPISRLELGFLGQLPVEGKTWVIVWSK